MPDTELIVRPADADELDQLARVWFEGWQESHLHLVPPALVRFRSLSSFRDRLAAALPAIRVVGEPGAPLGFCIVKDDELYQLFVAAAARGTGVAVALIDDGEARVAKSGFTRAWLACAIGNYRAARFYQKRGWHLAGTMVNEAETSEGTFPIEVWRYEKELTRGG